MKNVELFKSILGIAKFTRQEITDHCRERNRRKRYRQGKMSLRSFLGKTGE